jgi:mutator protein MutT
MEGTMIEVVGGFIQLQGRILLTQRATTSYFASRWESPGGKVEGDEAHHDTLRRELQEELGITPVEINGSAMFSTRVERDGKPPVFWSLYHVYSWTGAITLRELQRGLGWFTADEMCGLLCTPGNEAAKATVTHVMSCLQRGPQWGGPIAR